MEDSFEKRIINIRARIAVLRASLESGNRSAISSQTRLDTIKRDEQVSKQEPDVESLEKAKRTKDLEDIKNKLKPKKRLT
jgi:hypothetical protein